VPSSSMQADILIGAGCIDSIQAGAALLYEYGPAGRFHEAQRNGTIRVKEATCPAIQAGLTASEKGLPFMPLRGVIGSDIVRHRADEWKIIDNPFPPHDPILVVPAIKPEVALFHAPLADREGNLWIGRRGSFKLMAHAAKKTLATFEKYYDGNLFDDPYKLPGIISADYVTALSHQKHGAWPLHFGEEYDEDVEHMTIYAQASKSPKDFSAYLDRYVLREQALV
jgi:glutaconate CoA-transferase, subunit A